MLATLITHAVTCFGPPLPHVRLHYEILHFTNWQFGDWFIIKHGGVITTPLYIKLLPTKLTNHFNQPTNKFLTAQVLNQSQNSPSFTETKGLSQGHSSQSLIPIMSQRNPVYIFPLHFFNIHSDIIPPFTPKSSRSLPIKFSNWNFVHECDMPHPSYPL